MRVALLSQNAQAGDAIGNQVAEKLAFFLDRGADVRVFVETLDRLHPAVRSHCRQLDALHPSADVWEFLAASDLIVVEYGQAYGLLQLLPLLAGGKGRILFDYHGVTPPEGWGTQHRELLAQSQQQRGLVWCADAALVHSGFSRDELLQATQFPAERVYTLGHPLPDEADRPPRQDLRARLHLGPATLLLFVGRLAPNKRVPVLVEALAHLKDVEPPVHAVVIGDTGDVYAEEAERCRQRARELGVAERLHLLGHVSSEQLHDAYRSADLFVMPSRHEGFCIPVMEALAAGLPVVAARAGALPETVADAGLTFTPDDALDLARQARRVLGREECAVVAGSPDPATAPTEGLPSLQGCGDLRSSRWHGRETVPQPGLRFAIVSYRYGDDFVGGAETSLRSMAEALHREGHDVEVFTTCTRRESGWTNDYPEQTDHVGGVAVHRFRIDRHDAERHADAVRTLIEEPENLQAQCDLVQHSVRSARLLEALGRRSHSFDAIITGPYGVGLTHAVAQALPDRTLVVPCFHDEPLARLPLWQEAYSWAGGLLYHSAEEQDLAQRRLGINHPRATCCGTFFDSALRGDSERGRALVRGNRPYVVYCGRYSREKELPALLEAARGYHARHPDRFRFVFLGAGGVAIPREPWAHDLGFVDAATKRDVLAGAAALIQLSRCESLSLAALEAWAQGVPVIADRRCPVMAGHWQRSQAGRLVEDAAGLADVLDDLWHQPEPWREQGKRGRSYVAAHYGSRSSFVERLVQAGRALREPIADCMRRRGRERAVLFRRDRWREQFAALVEDVLHAPARPFQELLQIEPRSAERTAAAGAGEVLVPIRITHRGTHAAVHEGPARIVLHSTVAAADGATPNLTGRAIPLPSLLLPGQTLAAAVPVSVPAMPGNYCVSFHAGRADGGSMRNSEPGEAKLRLVVTTAGHHRSEHPCTPMLALIQTALADAERLHRLPADYADVTQGWFAAGKRWLKRKLLGNFKRAYVDVLSRQQSAFNARLLDVLRELAECCATLDHVGRSDTRDRLEASERRCRELEARLQRLQAMVEEPRPSLTASASAPDSSSTSCSGGTGLTRNASTPSCELR